MIKFRPFKSEYLYGILDLIKKSDSTDRSADTWNGNNMTAIVTFDDDKLIGVLPLERRSFSLGAGRFIDVLWISAAHVEPEYRSQGIGTSMERKIQEYFFPEYKAVFVYRSDETSPAYNWYKKLGYHEFLSILSFKHDVKRPDASVAYVLLSTDAEVQQWEDKLYDCFNRHVGASGGFPQRHRRFWSDKLKTHYYREFYTYKIIVLTSYDEISAYAFLGETAMKDGIRRVDVLEFAAPDDSISGIRDSLYNAVMNFASQHGFKEIRIQLSIQDPHLQWIKSLGFVNRWRFNIMGRLIDPVNYLRDFLSQRIDLQRDYQFILQTPAHREHSIGTGRNYIKLFAHNGLLNEILLCRCNISNAVDEGRLVVVDGDENNINVLESHFPLNKWRYFQIDYI